MHFFILIVSTHTHTYNVVSCAFFRAQSMIQHKNSNNKTLLFLLLLLFRVSYMHARRCLCNDGIGCYKVSVFLIAQIRFRMYARKLKTVCTRILPPGLVLISTLELIVCVCRYTQDKKINIRSLHTQRDEQWNSNNIRIKERQMISFEMLLLGFGIHYFDLNKKCTSRGSSNEHCTQIKKRKWWKNKSLLSEKSCRRQKKCF